METTKFRFYKVGGTITICKMEQNQIVQVPSMGSWPNDLAHTSSLYFSLLGFGSYISDQHKLIGVINIS
jgi:hypothetical protein